MQPVIRSFSQSVDSLVKDGRFNFGTYNQAIARINPLDAQAPLGRRMPRWFNNLRLKEWQACEMGNERFFMLAVVYNAKLMALVQFFVIDKSTGKKLVFEKKILPSQAKVASGLFSSQSSYQGRDFLIRFVNRLEKDELHLFLDISQQGKPTVEGEFVIQLSTEPLVICHPFAPNRGLYSHKCLQPMKGWLALGTERFNFSSEDSFFILDDHKGFYPYIMEYDWLCGARVDPDLGLVGFNLTRNQVLQPQVYNENCLWCQGKTYLLPAVVFSRPQGVYGPWQVKDEWGYVDLIFHPEYKGEVKLDLLVAESDYYGPCGWIEGRIRTFEDLEAEFTNLFGMGEQKRIRL